MPLLYYGSMAKPIIYVVDDEADILDLYKNLLDQEFDVHTFNRPSLFLEALQNQIPVLVITDLKMPEMDGLSMVRKSRELGFIFPFILLTGHLDKERALEAMEVGVFRVLEKPTDYNLLFSTIDQLFLEYEITEVRTEVRALMTQLRELYGSLRIIMGQYISEDVLNRSIIETDGNGKVIQKQSFEEIMEKLETRLTQLLKAEKVLLDMKTNNFKP